MFGSVWASAWSAFTIEHVPLALIFGLVFLFSWRSIQDAETKRREAALPDPKSRTPEEPADRRGAPPR